MLLIIIINVMALRRERTFKKEEVLVWWRHADGWRNVSEIGKTFHSGCMSWSVPMLVLEGPFPFSLLLSSMLALRMVFQRKWWPVSRPVHVTLSTDGDWCCYKWRGTSPKYLFIRAPLPRWPMESSPYSTIFVRRWSSILETCPA